MTLILIKIESMSRIKIVNSEEEIDIGSESNESGDFIYICILNSWRLA
jgi:hypothetical protein